MIVTLRLFLDCARDVLIDTFSNYNTTWWQRAPQLMAQIRLQPPDPFDFKTPDDWPRWWRFEQFRSASGLQEASVAKQVNTLLYLVLYCLGEEAESVVTSTNISEEEWKDYAAVLAKFDGFFQVTRNVIFERARFNRRCQLPVESAEQYIVELYNIAEHCNYGTLTSEMIRDRLVVGIQDASFSQRLQLDPELTLEKAKKIVRQREAVQEQQQVLKGATSGDLVELQRGCHRTPSYDTRRPQQQNPRHFKQRQSEGKLCFRCGKGQHPREKCPARDAVCHRCQKKGHYGACCLTKIDEVVSDHCCTCGSRNMDTISTIQGLSLESAFLDAIEDTQATTWTTTVKLYNMDVLFKLDTGEEVSAITVETYRKLNVKLSKPLKTLYGPSQATLTVNRQFEEKLEHQGKQTIQLVYVIQNLKRNLLGLLAIEALNLVVKVDSE